MSDPALTSLKQLLADDRVLGPGAVAEIGRQTAVSLGEMHSAGRSHGNVGLATIFVAADGSVGLSPPLPDGVAAQSGDLAALVAVVRALTADQPVSAGVARLIMGTLPRSALQIQQALAPVADRRQLLSALAAHRGFADAVAADTVVSDAEAVVPGADAVESASSGYPAVAPSPLASRRADRSRPERGDTVPPATRRRKVKNAIPSGLASTGKGRRGLLVLAIAGVLAMIWASVAAASPDAPQDGKQAASAPSAAAPASGALAVPSASAVPSAAAPDWRALLTRFDWVRASAFANASADQLAAADHPGSPADRHDRAMVSDLNAIGAGAEGMTTAIKDVTVERVTEAEAVIAVRDERSGYAVVTAGDRKILEQRPARGPATWHVTLTLGPEGWRIFSVAAAGP